MRRIEYGKQFSVERQLVEPEFPRFGEFLAGFEATVKASPALGVPYPPGGSIHTLTSSFGNGREVTIFYRFDEAVVDVMSVEADPIGDA